MEDFGGHPGHLGIDFLAFDDGFHDADGGNVLCFFAVGTGYFHKKFYFTWFGFRVFCAGEAADGFRIAVCSAKIKRFFG